MQRINLKKFYYPLYDEDIFIEVSDEVAVAILEEHRRDDNTRRNLWIHTYSLDESPEIENHFPEQICSAEEILLQREENLYREFLLGKLGEALATLTPKQLRRLKARFVDGMKYREIAEIEGIDTSIAHHSVRAAIRRLQRYYVRHGFMEAAVLEKQ
ncbi:MAG: RNA polymerase sigma factor [Faecousia sp.]